MLIKSKWVSGGQFNSKSTSRTLRSDFNVFSNSVLYAKKRLRLHQMTSMLPFQNNKCELIKTFRKRFGRVGISLKPIKLHALCACIHCGKALNIFSFIEPEGSTFRCKVSNYKSVSFLHPERSKQEAGRMFFELLIVNRSWVLKRWEQNKVIITTCRTLSVALIPFPLL